MDLFDISIYTAYLLVIVAALSAIVLPIINSLGDPKQLFKGLIGIGVMLVIFFVGYLLSGNEVTAVYLKNEVDAQASQLVGGALIAMYIFFIVSFASILVTEVLKLFK